MIRTDSPPVRPPALQLTEGWDVQCSATPREHTQTLARTPPARLPAPITPREPPHRASGLQMALIPRLPWPPDRGSSMPRRRRTRPGSAPGSQTGARRPAARAPVPFPPTLFRLSVAHRASLPPPPPQAVAGVPRGGFLEDHGGGEAGKGGAPAAGCCGGRGGDAVRCLPLAPTSSLTPFAPPSFRAARTRLASGRRRSPSRCAAAGAGGLRWRTSRRCGRSTSGSWRTRAAGGCSRAARRRG